VLDEKKPRAETGALRGERGVGLVRRFL